MAIQSGPKRLRGSQSDTAVQHNSKPNQQGRLHVLARQLLDHQIRGLVLQGSVPASSRGRRKCNLLGRILLGHQLQPDLVFSCDSKRDNDCPSRVDGLRSKAKQHINVFVLGNPDIHFHSNFDRTADSYQRYI